MHVFIIAIVRFQQSLNNNTLSNIIAAAAIILHNANYSIILQAYNRSGGTHLSGRAAFLGERKTEFPIY